VDAVKPSERILFICASLICVIGAFAASTGDWESVGFAAGWAAALILLSKATR